MCPLVSFWCTQRGGDACLAKFLLQPLLTARSPSLVESSTKGDDLLLDSEFSGCDSVACPSSATTYLQVSGLDLLIGFQGNKSSFLIYLDAGGEGRERVGS